MVTKRKTSTPVRSRSRAVRSEVAETSSSNGASNTARNAASFLNNNIIVVLLIVLAFFSGYLFFKVKNLEQTNTQAAAGAAAGNQAAPARPTELAIAKPSTNEHWRGDKNARYVWVEYSDYECPFCKQIHPSLVTLMSNYKDLAWVFRDYPLPFHPKAQKSAEATECAADQGGNDAFWKLTDAIYEKMPTIEVADIPELAGTLGLDPTSMKDCMDSGKNADKVKAMLDEGTKVGVQATPTNVIYDMKTGKTHLIEGALPYDQLKTELDAFIAANK